MSIQFSGSGLLVCVLEICVHWQGACLILLTRVIDSLIIIYLDQTSLLCCLFGDKENGGKLYLCCMDC